MPAPRVFCDRELSCGIEVALSDPASHHIARVLRMKPGEAITLFDGSGGEYDGAIRLIDKRKVTVHVTGWRETERESKLRVLLAQGVPAAERMDFTVQKAVELGVAGIQPLVTRRSIARLSGVRASERIKHWQRVVIAACEQCGRNRVPVVAPMLPLSGWLREEHAQNRLLLSPDAERSLRELELADGRVALLIGPEGGLDPEEQAQALAAGFIAVRLGPRVLRTETAALAALAAMQALSGDF